MVSVTCVLTVTVPTVATVLTMPTVVAVVVPALLGVAFSAGVLTAGDMVELAAVCAVA